MNKSRIAFIGDAHMVQPQGVHPFDYEKRRHYIDQFSFIKKMLAYVNEQAPDYVVFIGDVIDWYSPENIEYALNQISVLKMPWVITPGNHDYQLAVRQRAKFNNGVLHEWADHDQYICKAKATANWNQHGIYFGYQKIDLGNTSLFIADSALGFVPEAQENQFYNDSINTKFNIFATHVPMQHPIITELIVKNKGSDAISEYVQEGSPNLFQKGIYNRMQLVMLGHVHFTSELQIENIKFKTLPTSCLPGRKTEFEGVEIIDCP